MLLLSVCFSLDYYLLLMMSLFKFHSDLKRWKGSLFFWGTLALNNLLSIQMNLVYRWFHHDGSEMWLDRKLGKLPIIGGRFPWKRAQITIILNTFSAWWCAALSPLIQGLCDLVSVYGCFALYVGPDELLVPQAGRRTVDGWNLLFS